MCFAKERGCLGIRKLTYLNKALLGKWVWRFALKNDRCWKRVISFEYGKEDHGWGFEEV